MLPDEVIKIVQDFIAECANGCGLPLAWKKDILSYATEYLRNSKKEFAIFERIHIELCPTKK